MSSIIFIGLGLIVVVLLLVTRASKNITATATIESGNNKVITNLKFTNEDDIIAMAALYAIKMRWVLLSEPKFTQNIYLNVYNNTLKSWPLVPKVEMYSMLSKATTTFQVKIIKGATYTIVNTFPLKGVHSADLATNYFFLLAEISNNLSDEGKDRLGVVLKMLLPMITNIKDEGHTVLHNLFAEANNVLSTQ
jgi:hypothetical protein